MSLRIFSAFAVLAIVAVAASLAFASPLDMTRDRIDTEFARFKALFGKAYASPEIEAQRRATFAQNLAQLDKLQAQHPDEYGLTQFMDWTVAERKRILLRAPELPGVNRSDFVSKHAPPQSVLDQRDPLKAAATPAYYWSAYRTGVKNQDQCGSCWAFTISALAEARFVRGKVIQFPNTNPYSISPQQLVSCYARNCEGQYIDDAANWLVNRYTYLLSSWPYASGAGSVPACKTATNAWRPTWVQVLPLNRANISTTVYQREAVSIVIGVCADFYDYSPSSSRIYSCRCATSSYDGYHAMTIVGYNNSASGFYWIVKNSWDTTWGRSGYLYIADGTCSMYNAGRTFVTLW